MRIEPVNIDSYNLSKCYVYEAYYSKCMAQAMPMNVLASIVTGVARPNIFVCLN